MTGRTEAAVSELASLLELVCSPAPMEGIARSLGTPGPPAASSFETHIEPTAFRSYRAIDLQPWIGSDFGTVDVALADDVDLRPADLEPVLGPLQEVPRLHGGPQRLQGVFERTSLPAWAAIYLELDGQPGDERVTAITIRTEPEVADE